jgi:type I restriction enzyme S subunit
MYRQVLDLYATSVDYDPKSCESVDYLKELKSRIIADTVTGKIDVRNIEIPEFEEEETDSTVADSEDEEGTEE